MDTCCFHVLAVINSTAMNIRVHVSHRVSYFMIVQPKAKPWQSFWEIRFKKSWEGNILSIDSICLLDKICSPPQGPFVSGGRPNYTTSGQSQVAPFIKRRAPLACLLPAASRGEGRREKEVGVKWAKKERRRESEQRRKASVASLPSPYPQTTWITNIKT